jgi:two-component sensor histidine kinase
MRHFCIKLIWFFAFLLWNSSLVFAQFIDLSQSKPYKRVFVDTDNFGASYLDSLESAYPKIAVDTIRFSVLNDLAYYWHTRNLVKAMAFAQEALAQTKECKNELWEGRLQITEAAILLRMEELKKAEEVLESAKGKVNKSDLPFLNTQLGYIYERRGQLDKAADFALISLQLGTQLEDKKAIAMAYSDLSNLFWKQSKLDAGLEYGLKSLEIFEARGITDLDYDFTLYVVGNNYLAKGNYVEAKRYYEHALIIGERYGFYNNLSDIYISLVDLYAFLGEFERAEEAGQNALRYANLLHNRFMTMRSWLSIGKLEIVRKDYFSAIENLKKSIHEASDDFGDDYYLSQAYAALGNAYAGVQNYQDAYHAFSAYDTLQRNIFTAEADQRISQLRTEFDLANKESTIQLQESQIKKQKMSQAFLIITAVLLSISLLLAYKAIQNKFKINSLLRKQNEEKEFLLKEIHHRVKNNLEVVSSLLALQSAQIQDPNILEAMRASQHRVQSMAMIHQKLYMGKDLATVEMKDYFKDLSNYVLDAYDADARVAIEVVMEPLEVDVDVAIPIGLIVNELLTNSLKYAFPDQKHGKITIGLMQNENGLQLEVIDDGVGQDASMGNQGTGFGSQLIALLTKQLDGKMVLHTHPGTSVSFQFQYHKAA